MNALMFHPNDVPCGMKCFVGRPDSCEFREMCQYRWAILSSLKGKHRVAVRRWNRMNPYTNSGFSLQYQDLVDLFKVYLMAGFFCWYCLEPMVVSHGFNKVLGKSHIHHDDDYSLEHKVPLRNGGTNDLSNLAFCHIKCNNRVELEDPGHVTPPWIESLNSNALTIGDIYSDKKTTRRPGEGHDDYNRAGARKVA